MFFSLFRSLVLGENFINSWHISGHFHCFEMSQNLSFCYVSVSQKSSAQQSAVVTTTGEDASEALNMSRGPNLSQISHISTILPKDVINSVIPDEDDPILKNMIYEEYKQLEQEQKHREKCELEIKRNEAREKAALLWQKRKELEKQKVAEEKRKRAAPLKSNERKEINVGGKEEVQAHKAHAFPFPKNHPNPSPKDLPARKKHDAVPPQLLNVDLLAQIFGTETVADVIIDDEEACVLLDSRATADLMTLAYAKARNLDIRPMTELSDHFINSR